MRPVRMNQTRRALLIRSAEVVGFVALTAVAGRSTTATAKATKSEFMYQDRRRDGKNCGQCRFFASEAPNTDIGSCAIVEGTISREGWCLAFVPKIPA